MKVSRVNIITGHYGSGKTNFAVNLALRLAENGLKICLADLDIVNPYFRAADHARLLAERGIEVMAPVFANSNLDIPALPPAIHRVFNDRTKTVILDVGGDDAGAVALGQFSELILEENDFRHFFVINQRRALTRSSRETAENLKEIERASRLPVHCLVNNTNLSHETDANVILSSAGYADEISGITGLPVEYTLVREDLVNDALKAKFNNIFPIKVYVKAPWEN